MKDVIYDEYQNLVSEVLLRHSSLLDIITKLEQSVANTNRAAIKTITDCGCVSLNRISKEDNDSENYDSFYKFKIQDIEGNICEKCRDKIEEEYGNTFFYLTALANKLDINIYDVLLKEFNNMKTLGKFRLY
jgi:hypothetical protein